MSLLDQQTFEEAEKGFDETLAKEKGMNRDDRVHGALLILNELVRISSMEGEVRVNSLGYCTGAPWWMIHFCLTSVTAHARGNGGNHTAATGP